MGSIIPVLRFLTTDIDFRGYFVCISYVYIVVVSNLGVNIVFVVNMLFVLSDETVINSDSLLNHCSTLSGFGLSSYVYSSVNVSMELPS